MTYWQDKVVLVTGGSAGLGRAIATAYSGAGARVVITARDANRLHVAADEIGKATGRELVAIPADVTQDDSVSALVEQTIARHGRLDVLVNNVGKSTRGEAWTTTLAEFRELFEMNFLTLVRCSQAAAPHLIQSRGHLVNIGSLASKYATKFLGAYPASKFPVAAFSQQLRYELGPQGVHVLLVCPGPLKRDDSGSRYAQQASSLPPAAHQPGAGVRVSRLDPDQVAAKILRACQRHQSELVLPAKAKLLFALAQLWPDLGDWIIGRMSK